MSFELKLSGKDRAASRFIGRVRKALVLAALDEKKQSGISQQGIAEKLGVNRSVINRLLRGDSNLTLRSVAEIAWALGWEIIFELRKRPAIIIVTPPTTNVQVVDIGASTGNQILIMDDFTAQLRQPKAA